MCGIAGIASRRGASPPPPRDALVRMALALRHRGPDEMGVFRDRRCGLAHARLSIIDLATGQQPMGTADGRYWIAFNGEIFNYVELRDELVAAGRAFRTRSDTEVILQAYAEWGLDAFERLNGQWAIALWDRARRELVLARDRVGIRPLHVCERGDRVYFASEVKAIFAADPAIPRALDPRGLDQTFTFWSPVPPDTAFAAVREVRPGHVRVYRDGDVVERPYDAPRFPTGPGDGYSGSLDEAVAAVRAALERATSLRMLRADVPVGSYLSGGLDSSLVAALGRRAIGDRFHTFSLRFADAEYDETEYQRTMVARLGSDHHEIVVSRRDVADVFPAVVAHTERPVLRTAPAPLFLLSRLVRDTGIKVVLTGEGADEMFAGYDLFREGVVRRFWARQPQSRLRPLLLQKLYPYLTRSPVSQQAMARRFFGRNLDRWREPDFTHDTRWHTTSGLKRLFSADLRAALAGVDAVAELLADLPPEFSRWSYLARDQYLEIRTLLAGYLLCSQGDRMLMAHSVEGRFPFLDPDVVALAHSLPPEYKLRVLDEKHVLKRAAADLVPAAIRTRPKQPYRAPDALAFVGDGALPDYAAECLSERAIVEAGVFDPKAIAQLVGKCVQRAGAGQFSNADNMAIVGVLSTQLLHECLVRAAPDAGDPDAAVLTTDVSIDSDDVDPSAAAGPARRDCGGHR